MKKKATVGFVPEEKTIMRTSLLKSLKLFFTIILVCLQGVEISAQTTLVTINMENVSLEAILKEIQKQTGLGYLLSHEQIPEQKLITIHKTNATVREVMKEVLKDLSLDYEIRDNVIIIVPGRQKDSMGTNAQSTLRQTIRGNVVDKESGTPLAGANIIVLDSDPLIAGISDEKGNFRLKNVPVGRHTLEISYLGYKNLTIPEILVGSAKEVILTLELTESLTELKEVIVNPYVKGEPKNEMATVSARSFSVEESNRYAASISDPGRMALSFAGVNTNNDLSNQIIVRGNTPNGMIWRVEGVQIPVPNHFYEEGYDPGYVSILSSNMMENSDFYTGAFPAEYGNGTAGVFDITLRNGNNEKRESSFEFGLLGIDLSSEGPFNEKYKGSYLVNARYSTFSLMNLFGYSIDEDVIPEYTDLSFKINLPANKFGIFSLWGLGGFGSLSDEPIADSNQWEHFWQNEGELTRTRIGATGITHTIFPDSKSYFKSVVSCSGNMSIDESYELNNNYNREYDLSEKLTLSALRFSTMYNRKLSTKITLRSGLIVSGLYYNYNSKYIDSTNTWINDINGKGNTKMYQGYIQIKYKLNDKLFFNGGLHYLYLALNGDQSIEPRFGIKWALTSSQSISAGMGIHSRHESLLRYFIKIPDTSGVLYYPNKDLKLTKSNHFVVGYSLAFKKDIRLLIETYYQHLYAVPVSPDSLYTYSSINDDSYFSPLVNKGKGRNYGIELTIEKYYTHNFYFIITGSLYNAEYKPLDGRWYNSTYNNNFITNITTGKEFKIKDKNILGVNARFLWSGGKRGNPFDWDVYQKFETDEEYIYWEEKHRNAIKHWDYIRLDIGCKYKINNPRVTHEFGFDIQNVTNRLNVRSMMYYVENGEQYTSYNFFQGILPFFHYRIEF